MNIEFLQNKRSGNKETQRCKISECRQKSGYQRKPVDLLLSLVQTIADVVEPYTNGPTDHLKPKYRYQLSKVKSDPQKL